MKTKKERRKNRENKESREHTLRMSTQETQTTVGIDIEEKRKKRPDAWDYYERVLGGPKYFIAPMVDGSVLPFRVLCRRHGADIGVTPMIYR